MKRNHELHPFNQYPQCTKCLCDVLMTEYKVSYRKGKRVKDGKRYEAKPERLVRTCSMCGHWWFERCAAKGDYQAKGISVATAALRRMAATMRGESKPKQSTEESR